MKRYIIILFCLCFNGCGWANPEGFVKVAVLDETGKRLNGCEITVSFENIDEVIKRSGVSSTNSFFEAKAPASVPRYTVVVEKDGYYKSAWTYMFSGRDTVKNHYEPWGETKAIILRKIISPQKGKKSLIEKDIPVYNKEIGVDLEVGDLVAPYGNGVHSDFVFIFSHHSNKKLFSYVLKFPNRGDGLISHICKEFQQSIYRWPHKAPLDGYLSVLKRKLSCSYDVDPNLLPKFEELPASASSINYIFRIRTKYDDDGNIISAYYGKIMGSIQIYPNGKFSFGYWLNTDPHSRSLESTHPTSP